MFLIPSISEITATSDDQILRQDAIFRHSIQRDARMLAIMPLHCYLLLIPAYAISGWPRSLSSCFTPSLMSQSGAITISLRNGGKGSLRRLPHLSSTSRPRRLATRYRHFVMAPRLPHHAINRQRTIFDDLMILSLRRATDDIIRSHFRYSALHRYDSQSAPRFYTSGRITMLESAIPPRANSSPRDASPSRIRYRR